MTGKLAVTIDRDECIVCGACWLACLEFIEESDYDGRSQVVIDCRVADDAAVGRAPGNSEDGVRDAADACPVEVIYLG